MTKLRVDPHGVADSVVDESKTEELPAGTGVVVEEDAADGGEPKQAKLPARARLNEDGSVTLKLVRPVTLKITTGGKQREEIYQELVFHELSGLDLRLAAQESDEMKRTLVTLARATSMPLVRMTVLFDLLAQRDVTAMTAVVTFLSE